MSGASVQKGNSGKATLRDVAEAADCSIALASHVLNKSYGNISCTPEMLAKIERVAEELGYASMRSKHLAQSARSYCIGVNIVGLEHNAELSKNLAELEKVAIAAGYSLMVFGFSASIDEALVFFEKKIKKSQIDILVDLSGSLEQKLSTLVDKYISAGLDIASRCKKAIASL